MWIDFDFIYPVARRRGQNGSETVYAAFSFHRSVFPFLHLILSDSYAVESNVKNEKSARSETSESG
jgi:hypothetical protein